MLYAPVPKITPHRFYEPLLICGLLQNPNEGCRNDNVISCSWCCPIFQLRTLFCCKGLYGSFKPYHLSMWESGKNERTQYPFQNIVYYIFLKHDFVCWLWFPKWKTYNQYVCEHSTNIFSHFLMRHFGWERIENHAALFHESISKFESPAFLKRRLRAAGATHQWFPKRKIFHRTRSIRETMIQTERPWYNRTPAGLKRRLSAAGHSSKNSPTADDLQNGHDFRNNDA